VQYVTWSAGESLRTKVFGDDSFVGSVAEMSHLSESYLMRVVEQAPALITLYRKSVELVLLVIGVLRDPLIL
jgi:hypothetical protein